MTELYLPGADRSSQWYANKYRGVVWSDALYKCVWHTTEGTSWPGYSGGSTAPTITIDPRTEQIRQHFPANMSSRALANLPGGVETNTDRAFQIEVISFSDRVLSDRYRGLWVGDFTEKHLAFLARIALWLNKHWGIPLALVPKFTRNPRYGLSAPQRLSGQAYKAFRGHLPHASVPENSHWDTGALNLPQVLRLAQGNSEEGGETDVALSEKDIEAIAARINRTLGDYNAKGEKRDPNNPSPMMGNARLRQIEKTVQRLEAKLVKMEEDG